MLQRAVRWGPASLNCSLNKALPDTRVAGFGCLGLGNLSLYCNLRFLQISPTVDEICFWFHLGVFSPELLDVVFEEGELFFAA